MADFCRYCKVIGHIKDNCDKRPADSQICFICHQKGHISYQCTRSKYREPQPHKRPRNREPTSTLFSRRIATPKIKKGSKTTSLLDFDFGPASMSPAHDIQSSTTTSSSNVEDTKNTPVPNDGLAKSGTVYIPPPSDGPGPDSGAPLMSKYALKSTTSVPSVSSTVLSDKTMTELSDVDFGKFSEISQDEAQDPPSQSEMEV